jgi:phospholipid/cholesterol/gamma-HCH transport system permease protein
MKQTPSFSMVDAVKNHLCSLAEAVLFIKKALVEIVMLVRPPYEWDEVLYQCYKVGYRSLALVAVTGFIMGLVLTLQSRPVLAEFGAESWLPSMVSISFIREIGPVVTALICAGKIGSGIGAEVGSMKVTEQIDAMEVSATNPFKFIVATRIVATSLMVPLLAMFSDVFGMLGSFLGVNLFSQVDFILYLYQAFSSLEFQDFLPALIKTFLFGFVIGTVGCHRGMNAGRGTESVGIAANSAVVISSLLIFFVDLLVVQVTNLLTAH